MHEPTINTEARERVLHAAERLFAEKGYTAVTLRDIASAVGIKHASLYHHVPGGKEELFVEVTRRNLQRHNMGLTQAIESAAPNVRAQLYAVAEWLLSQPPMDLVRMTHSDMPAINQDQAARLSEEALEALIRPIEVLLAQAQKRGEIEHHNIGLVAGGLLGMIESLYSVPESAFEGGSVTVGRRRMAHELIDVLLNGLHKRD